MKVRRVMSLMLVLVLMMGLLAACGGGGSSSSGGSESGSTQESGGGSSEVGETGEETSKVDGEGYTANFLYLVAAEGADQQKVNEAADALAMKEINMHINMIPMTFGTFSSQMSVMLAGGEPLDIFPVYSSSFGTYIESQYIVNLADYLDYLQGTVEVFGEDANCGYVGDFLVGFSQMKERGYPTGLVVRKDIFDELGYKVEDFNVSPEDYSSFDQITELFAAVKEAHPEMICLDGTSVLATGAPLSYTDNLGDDFGVLENYGQTTTITNYFESEQFKKFCEIAKQWYDAGYTSQDIAVNQDTGETKLRAGNAFSFICYVKPNTSVEKLAQTGYETEVIYMGDTAKSTNAVNSAMFCMANAAEDKVKAAQFMNWIYTSGEFNDLINWGVEGVDWVLDDDGLATFPEGVDAQTVGYHNDFGWIYPNQFAGHPWAGNPVDIWDQYRKYNSEMKKSMAFGFTFDSTPVANEEAQLVNVENEYLKDLSCGVVDDVDASIAEFNQKLYDSGLQKVMDEKQAQLNAWLEEQG